MAGSLLVYISSQAIKNFCASHPIIWPPPWLSTRGGPGDQAGLPPVPSVEVFLDLLRVKHGLFTQEDFWQASVSSWGNWYSNLGAEAPDGSRALLQRGLKAKAYRNFYPSMIDSLHVWAMLVEAGEFDRCWLDSVEDYTSKTDLTVCNKSGIIWRIALQGRARNIHRPTARGLMPTKTSIVNLPSRKDRPATEGNKQWFILDDFFTPVERSLQDGKKA